MNVLVDSSVWIDYFKSGKNSKEMDDYIDQNIICTNDLILAELIPSLRLRNETKVIKLLNQLTKITLTINWRDIIEFRTTCIKNGINKIGIPDLVILDNVIKNNLTLYTFDKHFVLIKQHINFNLL
jgi:predicted nucleic acid-binding protein